jgi:MFS family permease
LDAVTFAVSAIIFVWAIPSGRVIETEKSSYLEDLKAGLQFVRRNRLILTLMITIAITNFLDAPLFAVVMPVYAHQFYGEATNLGLMISTFGGGALAGALLYGMFGKKIPRRSVFIGAFLLVGIPFWILAFTPSFPVVLGLLLISGLAAGPINPVIMTVAQERVPHGMRGRVFGLMTSGAYIATPLGMLLTGYLVEFFSVTTTILIIAGGYFLVTTAQFFNRVLFELETDQESNFMDGENEQE